MSPVRASGLDALAQARVVDARVAPAAAVAVAVRGRAGWDIATGAAGQRSVGDPSPVDPDSPFDLASVTKPFVAAAAARAARRGALALRTPLASLLPIATDTPTGRVPLELLLAHRAGLEAHRELYAPLVAGRAVERRRALLEAARARRPEARGEAPEHGFPPLYSDLGYLLAGASLERALGASLADVVDQEVLQPLGLGDVGPARKWLGRDPTFARRVVPSEHVAWRGGELCGVVHDENAWALAGHGLAGHAGLFGTAAAVAGFGAAVLDALADRDRSWLGRDELLPLVRERPGGSLRAGFDGRAPSGSSAGDVCGPRTFGHLGFTGTSLWCDPDADVAVVLLTNRVNPSRTHVAIRAARPGIHDALFAFAAAFRPPGR